MSSLNIRVKLPRKPAPVRCNPRIVRQIAATWSAEELWSSDYTWDGEHPSVSSEWSDVETWSGADSWGGTSRQQNATNLLRGQRVRIQRI